MENKTLKYIPGYYPYQIDIEGNVYRPNARTGFPVKLKEQRNKKKVYINQGGKKREVMISELYRRAFNKLLPED
ncbi:hypothetical protein [Paenibacillus kribbensis]|uniref:hypothetical protein n=1 Tax=Paenibacillus kribbensis TaxID=172713 RepID=UPI0008386D39|nr:hypothetical protein [Paenibacillus kribbensis]